MDENKNVSEEIVEEAAEETVEAAEEVAVKEAVEESAEAVTEEAADEAEAFEEGVVSFEEEEDSSEAEKYVSVERLIDENARLKTVNKILSGCLAVIAAVAIIFSVMKLAGNFYNPYNHMGYPNFSGMTVDDFAEMYGFTLDEIKEEYNLPDDVKGDTYFDVIEYLIPVGTMADNYGVDFETMKEAFQFSDDITPESTWGEAYDSIPLSILVGEGEEFEEFKENYGFGDEITTETPWGKVRKKVLKQDYEEYLAEQATADEFVVE